MDSRKKEKRGKLFSERSKNKQQKQHTSHPVEESDQFLELINQFKNSNQDMPFAVITNSAANELETLQDLVKHFQECRTNGQFPHINALNRAIRVVSKLNKYSLIQPLYELALSRKESDQYPIINTFDLIINKASHHTPIDFPLISAAYLKGRSLKKLSKSAYSYLFMALIEDDQHILNIDAFDLFNEIRADKKLTQHTCIHALKCIQKHQLTGEKNFSAFVFETAMSESFSSYDRTFPEFYSELSFSALLALSVDQEIEFEIINKFVDVALKNEPIKEEIFSKAIQCIKKSNSTDAFIRCEQIMRWVNDMIHLYQIKKLPKLSDYPFSIAIHAIAEIMKEHPVQTESAEQWIRQLIDNAKEYHCDSLIFHNGTIKAYTKVDSPNSDFAKQLIFLAFSKLNHETRISDKSTLYNNAINLYGKIGEVDQAMKLLDEASQHRLLNDVLGFTMLNVLFANKRKNTIPLIEHTITLVEKIKKAAPRHYGLALMILVEHKMYDYNFSKNIVSRAETRRKLNPTILAFHFEIALHSADVELQEHVKIYEVMKEQMEHFEKQISSPDLYKNLLLLNARSKTPDYTLTLSIYKDAKQIPGLLTQNVYDALLEVIARILTSKLIDEDDKQKHLHTAAEWINEAAGNGIYPNGNFYFDFSKSLSIETNEALSFGKLYFQLRDCFLKFSEKFPTIAFNFQIRNEAGSSAMEEALKAVKEEMKECNLNVQFNRNPGSMIYSVKMVNPKFEFYYDQLPPPLPQQFLPQQRVGYYPPPQHVTPSPRMYQAPVYYSTHPASPAHPSTVSYPLPHYQDPSSLYFQLQQLERDNAVLYLQLELLKARQEADFYKSQQNPPPVSSVPQAYFYNNANAAVNNTDTSQRKKPTQ